MPACPSCSAAIPAAAVFCPRCGRAIESAVAVRETPQSLLRQTSTLLQQHSQRKLGVKFVGRFGVDDKSPRARTKSIRFHTGMGIFDSSRAFIILPALGKFLFADGNWADIRLQVLNEVGFDDARLFADAYRARTGKNVEIVKNYK